MKLIELKALMSYKTRFFLMGFEREYILEVSDTLYSTDLADIEVRDGCVEAVSENDVRVHIHTPDVVLRAYGEYASGGR